MMSTNMTKKLNSLELLENCLALAHNCRANTLRDRERQYALAMEKRRRKAKLFSQQCVTIDRPAEEEDSGMLMLEEERESMMDQLSHEFSANNSVQSSPSKLSGGGSGLQSDTGVLF